MEDIMIIVKSLQEQGLLIKGISKKIKNEVRKQKVWFIWMFSGILPAIMLGDALRGKEVIRAV